MDWCKRGQELESIPNLIHPRLHSDVGRMSILGGWVGQLYATSSQTWANIEPLVEKENISFQLCQCWPKRQNWHWLKVGIQYGWRQVSPGPTSDLTDEIKWSASALDTGFIYCVTELLDCTSLSQAMLITILLFSICVRISHTSVICHSFLVTMFSGSTKNTTSLGGWVGVRWRGRCCYRTSQRHDSECRLQ